MHLLAAQSWWCDGVLPTTKVAVLLVPEPLRLENFAKTSPPTLSTTPLPPPAAPAQDGPEDFRSGSQTPTSPALSTASTADGEDDIESSPALPPLPAPKLSERASAILRASPADLDDDSENEDVGDDNQFGTVSWGSPYPRSDLNLHRQSFSSEGSDDDPIHHLDISTPFLRPPPVLPQSQLQPEPQLPVSAAAAVLVHRVRRQARGLTEGWIRNHTVADQSAEPRHWLSDGSSSEHSSLSGSDSGWFHDQDPRTPKASGVVKKKSRSKSQSQSRHPRATSSLETLKAEVPAKVKVDEMTTMSAVETDSAMEDVGAEAPKSSLTQNDSPIIQASPRKTVGFVNDKTKHHGTPTKLTDKPLPREPPMTPRIKKKVPWKGKNIMILVPRDDERGLPGRAPLPLCQDEINRMFTSWRELGYNVDGFDLLIEKYESAVTSDSQSRDPFPSFEDLAQDHANRNFKVTLPDLNAWKNYVNELQEAKLRALGVSFGEEEPDLAPSISSQPSRQPSAQYPPLPFSPPIPTSSASSNHVPGFSFSGQFLPSGISVAQSPALPSGASPVPFGLPGKFNPRQSISFPTSNSPFQQAPPGWPSQADIMHGLNHHDPPPMMNLGGIIPPHSAYGPDGFPQTGSPAFNMHQRRQSLQYLPQQLARASPRLQEVREDEEEEVHIRKSPSKTPEPTQRNAAQLQAEIDEAEYHLEEKFRHELEHEDWNPQTQAESINHVPFAPTHTHQPSGGFVSVDHFANEPSKPLVLHHPRPHSRGHSLSQSFFRDPTEVQEVVHDGSLQHFTPLKDIPEAQHVDESYEIQTNPSNLGTPVQNIDFAAAFNQHQKTLSATSNPWHDSVSIASGTARHSSHGSKPSLSKFNVEAPEFKFNPANSFTPGLFNFSGNSFQPAAFQAAPEYVEPPSFNHASQFSSSKINVNAPTFSPGQGEFSFSASGPKFRPDAPSFTPFQPQSASAANPVASGDKDLSRRTDSIFGNIQIDPEELPKAAKKTKALPSMRPSSRSSTKSAKFDSGTSAHGDEEDRHVIEESRVKRAKSAAPEGDDVPLFAERPDDSMVDIDATAVEHSVKEAESVAEDVSVEGDHAAPADTSMSSIATSDQIDTKATTAASSEASPADQTGNKWASFESSLHEPPSDTPPAFIPETTSLDDNEESSTNVESAQASPAPVSEVLESAPVSARPKLTPKGLASSRFATPPSKSKGLAASRFARTPSPVLTGKDLIVESVERETESEPARLESGEEHEPTFEEIDAVMQQMENDHFMGINKAAESFKWPHPAVEKEQTPSDDLQPPSDLLRDGRSLTPRQYDDSHDVAAQPMLSTELEDPFVDPPLSSRYLGRGNEFDEGELDSEVASDWEGAFSEDEHSKLQSRAQFFDARVNEVVGGLLASRLEPLEKTLFSIQHTLATKSKRAPSSRREVRSVSAEIQESDADDEDEEQPLHRSMSPKRDRRMEQIRLAVTEALVAQQRNQIAHHVATEDVFSKDETVLKSLEEIKEQLAATVKSTLRDEQLNNTIEETKPHDELAAKVLELQAKAMDLEQRLHFEQDKVEKEVAERRAAEDAAAELNRKLQAAETRVEVEIINRSVFDQRVADLEERLRHQEDHNEEEVKSRRAAEDRLSEVQRSLQIATEEETRLRDVLEERDQLVKSLEQSGGKTALRMATLEAARNNWTQNQAEMTNRVNALEADLRNVRQDNHNWRAEAERADEAARRSNGELAHVVEENKRLHKSLNNVATQLEENERLRESWRSKFMSLQEDMGLAAREVAEENARRTKKDQAMLARQEVLEARLQAEAKTRERLEVEMERLQENERSGMRAVNECNRLESLLSELRTENFKLQQAASRYQREFEEARESGASEVKRTRMALQTEVDAANNQVNVIREEYEEQNSKLRSEIDNLKLEIDTAKAQNEMLLEDAHSSKATELEELNRKHQNELEDMQTRYERQVNNAIEDGQRTEQHLLERLSLSTSKTEHLQDRILHLEEKLEITKQAAAAAAQAAKSVGIDSASVASSVQTMPATKLDIPEKISPQALRESIMVLQEQLQAREQRIEELEQTVADLDPDAASKISKRDDEISWLRELLAVRHGDLQDIIIALSQVNFDRAAVKDAAIRLKANLQMEEQERERAMNGGSALTLPNIAQTLQAATPRVAQAVGPIAAAWGNWRKGSTSSFRSISGALTSPAVAVGTNATPSKGRSGSVLGGLLTPPASGLRQTPVADSRPQPTAFSSTGRRFTAQSVQSRARTESTASRRSDRTSVTATPPRRQELREEPMTPPPMMHQSVYDSDAQPGDFDDHDFFEED